MRRGAVRVGRVHLHVEYPPKLAISDLGKRRKGRTSRSWQGEYPELKRRYWGNHFWALGYGAWSTGNIEEMIQKYPERHRNPSQGSNATFLFGMGVGALTPSNPCTVHSGLV